MKKNNIYHIFSGVRTYYSNKTVLKKKNNVLKNITQMAFAKKMKHQSILRLNIYIIWVKKSIFRTNSFNKDMSFEEKRNNTEVSGRLDIKHLILLSMITTNNYQLQKQFRFLFR